MQADLRQRDNSILFPTFDVIGKPNHFNKKILRFLIIFLVFLNMIQHYSFNRIPYFLMKNLIFFIKEYF